jgi:hypothetical protein
MVRALQLSISTRMIAAVTLHSLDHEPIVCHPGSFCDLADLGVRSTQLARSRSGAVPLRRTAQIPRAERMHHTRSFEIVSRAFASVTCSASSVSSSRYSGAARRMIAAA